MDIYFIKICSQPVFIKTYLLWIFILLKYVNNLFLLEHIYYAYLSY